MSSFNNKIVVISGGTRGIGLACAKAFAARDASVVMLYRHNQAAATQALDAVKIVSSSNSSQHQIIQCDIADAQQVEQAIESVIKTYSRIDVLVNNAGIGDYHPIESTSYQQWQDVWANTINTNLIGCANLSFCCAKHMMQEGTGQIVSISSRGAFRGEPDKPAYGASKAGVNALNQSLAVKLAPYGIFVGVVAPGFVETELTAAKLSGEEGKAIRKQSPLNRVATPEDVANAVLYLASDTSNFSTGTILDVNGASYLRS
ncbi:MAG: SDR family oxidoreductase [Gammaproteobacteria bacterium]|nr:SDR family oxidoreductase [Gammaproteobacteria bacterium]